MGNNIYVMMLLMSKNAKSMLMDSKNKKIKTNKRLKMHINIKNAYESYKRRLLLLILLINPQNTYTISIKFLIKFIIKYSLNNTSNSKVIISDHIINSNINKWIISTFASGTQMSLLITWNYIKLSHGASLYVILS